MLVPWVLWREAADCILGVSVKAIDSVFLAGHQEPGFARDPDEISIFTS